MNPPTATAAESQPDPERHALPRRLRRFLLGALVLVAAYLLGLNALLNSGLGHRLMNSHPNVVRIDFDYAWMTWPGLVHASHAHVVGEDSEVQYEVRADRAQLRFTPGGLYTRTVTATAVRAEGISVRIRLRTDVMPPPARMEKLPPITGFATPLRADDPELPPPTTPGFNPVGVSLQDIDAHDLREVWVDDYRFLGSLDVRGGFYIQPYRRLRVDDARIEVRSGTLTTDEREVLYGVRGRIQASVLPLDLAHADLHALAQVSARIDLQAGIRDLRFLNYYLARAPQVRLDGGAGELAVHLRLDRGILGEGTELEISSPRVLVAVPYFDASGGGHVRLQVDAARRRLDLAVELSAVTVVERSTHQTCLRGDLLRVRGETHGLDLSQPPEVDLRVELPEAVASDLRFLNQHIPSGVPVRIERGVGRISARFHLDTERQRGDGTLDLDGEHVMAQNASARLAGRLRVHGHLGSIRLDTLETNLGGSTLALEDVTITTPGHPPTPHWWARIQLAPSLVHPNAHPTWDTTVHVAIKNLRPVVDVVGANLALPSIVRSLSNIEDVRVEARLEVDERTLDLSNLEVVAGKIGVRGALHIAGLPRKVPHKEGALLFTWNALAVGLGIHDAETHVVLVQPTKWFQEHVVAIRAPTHREAIDP